MGPCSPWVKHLGRPAGSCVDQSDVSYHTVAADSRRRRCCYAAMGVHHAFMWVVGEQLSMIRHPPLVFAARPSDFDRKQMLAELERICRRCANSSTAVPGCAWARPLRRESPVGKCFACRTELVTNPVTMSRKSQRMTTRPSCPTTPLLAG